MSAVLYTLEQQRNMDKCEEMISVFVLLNECEKEPFCGTNTWSITQKETPQCAIAEFTAYCYFNKIHKCQSGHLAECWCKQSVTSEVKAILHAYCLKVTAG